MKDATGHRMMSLLVFGYRMALSVWSNAIFKIVKCEKVTSHYGKADNGSGLSGWITAHVVFSDADVWRVNTRSNGKSPVIEYDITIRV